METSHACSKMRSDAIAAYIQQVPLPLTSKRSPARHVSSSSAAPFVSSASVAGVISAMHTSCGGVGGTAGGGGTEFATRRAFLFCFLNLY